MYGYMGKLLRVDLSKGTAWAEPLNEEYAREYVGGSGLAARYLYDVLQVDIDPLGPDNPLVFMTGPLVGTAMPSSGRFSVCARSPLTGIWGEANSGGFFGPELRFAGYDGVLVTGQARRPLWLSIVDGQAELRDAAEIWGKDSYETQRQVREVLGDGKARVACIGPAGENAVKMAAVMNDHGRAAARTGMGAVMGAKRLKAVAVRGHERVPLADGDGMKSLAQEIIAGLAEDLPAMSLQMAGTACYVDMALMFGDMPIRYYQQGEWAEGSNLSGVLMVEQYQNRNTACYRCPIACGRETRAPRYNLEKVDGPEYETLGALGSLLLIADLEEVIYANHLCNRYGLDTISVGAAIGLACELAERGLLQGQDIHYGDAAAVHRLIEQTARREGLGAILAEGSAALAEHCGAPELAVVVNRLDVPMHDARAFAGMAVSYALSPRGACHMQGDMYGVETGQCLTPELGILAGERFESGEEKGRLAARHQAWRNLYNAMTLCQFQNPGLDKILRGMNAATGWELPAEELLAIGKRILTLKRQLNMRLGLTPAADRLPALLLKPLDGGTEGQVPHMSALLAGAYAELGWDAEGKPGQAIL